MQTGISGRSLSPDEFVQNLKDSQILLAEELSAVHASPPAGGEDGMSLARALVAKGILTEFQMEAVCQRRFEQLRIGNYVVLDRLGEGGMGTVYKARHRRMKRLVAIKVLLRRLCEEPTFILRFQREVETVARLSHPNVVMAYDADEAEVGHFLVMEFVEGRDLSSLVREKGGLPVRVAVHCLLQAAAGLEYAHQQGIVHRDIKPANLLLQTDGVVKVADLGLARLNPVMEQGVSKDTGLTQAGGILGTVDFMSPEQGDDSTTVDHRADIYSLGCTLYFLLTGQSLYRGESVLKILLRHRDAPIPSLQESRPDCPASLADLFQRMVAKSAADRPQSMTAVIKELKAIEATLKEGPGIEAVEKQSEERPPPAPAPGDGQTVALPPPTTRHGSLLKVLLVEPSRTQAVIIRKLLQGVGIEPTATVPTAQSALAEVRKAVPNVIISAMHLKDMTGVQLARQVQAEKGSLAPGFVLISSESENADVGSLSSVTNTAILQKPFSVEQLVEVMNRVAPRSLQGPSAVRAADTPASSRPETIADAGRATASSVPSESRNLVKVLLADDSAAARSHVRSVLRGLGFTQVVEVPDGAQAVATVAREPFDLVITDYNMPLMDGQGLVGFLRQYGPTAKVPILLVTSEQDPARLEAMRSLGVTAICDKRFQAEVVKEVLDRLFP